MLTILATCLLYGSAAFVPPSDWQILKIEGIAWPTNVVEPVYRPLGRDITPGGEPRASTRIQLQRSMRPGEIIEPPAGCKLEMKQE
jgi:hypothetical protein